MDNNPTPATKKRVLNIEDEHFIGQLYERALTRAGYHVTTISDGEAGLKAAMEDTYDIILLDIMVPNLLGIDILGRLRRDVPNLKAKIIITTNLEQDETARKSIEKQADGYLIKAEITPRQLVDFLQHLDV